MITLAHLHSRFPTCLCLPLGLDVDLSWNLWVKLILGFPRLRDYFWFLDWYLVWDLRLSPQCGGSGPFWVTTWLGGSSFYSYHWDPSTVVMDRVLCLHFLSFYLCVLWWMVISLWWIISLIVLYFVSWIWKGWCNLLL